MATFLKHTWLFLLIGLFVVLPTSIFGIKFAIGALWIVILLLVVWIISFLGAVIWEWVVNHD